MCSLVSYNVVHILWYLLHYLVHHFRCIHVVKIQHLHMLRMSRMVQCLMQCSAVVLPQNNKQNQLVRPVIQVNLVRWHQNYKNNSYSAVGIAVTAFVTPVPS